MAELRQDLELAGILGVDPGPLMLRELVWMYAGRRREQSLHTGHVMALLANCHRDSKRMCDAWDAMRHTSVHARFNANYRRCLQHAGDDGLIVLEDDVFGASRLVSLPTPGPRRDTGRTDAGTTCWRCTIPVTFMRSPRGVYYQSYVASSFYGTQALYYAPGVAAAVMDHLAATPSRTVDMALRNRLVKDQNVYATIRSLAQHIGYTSTGLAGHMHRAADFHVPWPAERGY